MKRMQVAFLATLALLGASTAGAAIDKAFYHDPAVGYSWQNATAAQALDDYFSGKGYTRLDATEMATWMEKHIAAGDTSVVIFVTDLMPDTVMDTDANTDSVKATNSIFNRYLQTGGKVVYLADWPAYYLASTDGSRTTWNDVGAAASLGFAPSVWGYTDYGTPTIFTDEGKKWGLTKPWNSLRAMPSNSSALGLVLGNPTGHPEAAMPWVKMYIGRPGSGFTFLYDHPTGATEFTPEDMAQIQAVAEYFPAGEVKPDATVNVTLKNADGSNAPGEVVRLAGAGVSITGTTDDNGVASFKTVAGDYTASLGAALSADPTRASVTVAAAGTQAVTLTKPTMQDISSAGGVKWELKLPATPAPDDGGASPRPTDDPKSIPTASGFVELTVPSATHWDDLDATDNIYGWYRAKVTVPDNLVGKDLIFGGWNLDDEDWTYWNGQQIGHTNSWNTVRTYIVPGSLVQKTNDIVILGRDGGGGGGLSIETDVPNIWQALPSGSITGKVLDASGKAVPGTSLAISGKGAFGDQGASVTVDAEGNYTVFGLGEGTFTINVTPGTSASGVKLTKPAAVTTTVKSGQATTVPNITLNSISIPALPAIAAVDRFVYYDDAYSTNWINAASATAIRDYFVTAGYKEIDAAGLADTMKSYAASGTPSVVVTANDIFPETVVDISSGGVQGVNIVNDYLNNGGRIVFSGDIPFYNVALTEGGNLTPGDAGAPAILGFNTSPGGRDVADVPVLTDAAKGMGLTDTWQRSLRPSLPGDVDVVLASAQGGARAAGWIKFYAQGKGQAPGLFARWIDATEDEATYTVSEMDILPNLKKLAEFSGVIPGSGPVVPLVKSGDLNGDDKINVQDATLSLRIAVGLLTPTDAQKAAGDVNKDGKLNIQDTTLILQVAVGNKPASDLK